jgi:hypothetical protein
MFASKTIKYGIYQANWNQQWGMLIVKYDLPTEQEVINSKPLF